VVVLRGLGASAVGLKLCIPPLGCTGGVRAELLVRTPTGIAYLGHLYAGESGQFRPLIFFAVRCGVSSDRYNLLFPSHRKSQLL